MPMSQDSFKSQSHSASPDSTGHVELWENLDIYLGAYRGEEIFWKFSPSCKGCKAFGKFLSIAGL